MKKIEYDKLYIAFPVFDAEYETEMYEHYETMGTIEHNVIVSPKKVLVYSKVDQDGNVKYYNYETGEEVKESSYESSFETNSSPLASIYCCYINGLFALPIPSMREHCIARYEAKKKEVGYFIPFSQYMEERFGISVDSMPPSVAHKVLRVLNIGCGKGFKLSFDKEIARRQLEEMIGYHFGETKKVDL